MNSTSARPARGLSYFLAASSDIALDWERVSHEHQQRLLELLANDFDRPAPLPGTFEELMVVFSGRALLKNVSGCCAELLLLAVPALPVKLGALFLYKDHPVAMILNPREPDAVGVMCTNDNWLGVDAEELRQLCAEASEGKIDERGEVGVLPSTPRMVRSASLRRRASRVATPASTTRQLRPPSEPTAPALTREGSSSGVKRRRAEVEAESTAQPRRVRKDTITGRFHRDVVVPLQLLRRREDPVVFLSGKGFKMEPLKSLLPKPPMRERIAHFIQTIKK